MLTRNLCSVMCIVALFLMGVTTTNDSAKADKALIDGDCKCVEEDCPGLVEGPVACKYGQVGVDENQVPIWKCQCPASDYVKFIASNPRLRKCVDGPNTGDKSCECKCEGTKAPGCGECISTCTTRPAEVPDPDPCANSSDFQFKCEGGSYQGQQWPPTTCTPA